MDDRLCLIVDDEPAIRQYLGLLLLGHGIRSLEAENAIDALRIMHRIGNGIGLMITDIQMPGDMNGIDLAYSVKNSFSLVPVILISGSHEKGPEGFLFVRKPFRSDHILGVIDRAMQRAGDGK